MTQQPETDAELRETYRRLIHTAQTQDESAQLLDAILTLGRRGYVLNADESDWIPAAAPEGGE